MICKILAFTKGKNCKRKTDKLGYLQISLVYLLVDLINEIELLLISCSRLLLHSVEMSDVL